MRPAGLILASAALLVGCGTGPGAVAVPDVPQPTGTDAAGCAKLAAALPDTIGDNLHARTVQPKTPYVRAWGKPAVVLRCGVGLPAGYTPTAVIDSVNGVGWYADVTKDAAVFTAVTRHPRVSVAVPSSYEQAADILLSLADPVRTSTTGT